MNWSNKKTWLFVAGVLIFALVIVGVLVISAPFIPVQMCTLVGCIGGLNIEITDLPQSAPYEISVSFPSGETQTLNCGGETDESIPFEKSCFQHGAFFGLPSDVKPPREITVVINTSEGQWTRTVAPKYEKFQPNGADCPPVCYNANITITLEQ